MARKSFDIPKMYRSPIIRKVKEANKVTDPRKKDLAPTELDFGPLKVLIPRHFGFCYGVENAIDIAYRTVESNPDKNIYLLSEMIHNPTVNEDLLDKGVKFLFDTDGTVRIPIESLSSEDVVIVPAFGTTLEIQEKLQAQGIDPYQYNTTCPFVEKVWKRGSQLGKKGYSLVVHGKHEHEETRATFSHSSDHSPTLVVLNPDEARILADIMTEERPLKDFEIYFGHKSTDGFNPRKDLEFFGVINQTTMLAQETQEVMDILKKAAEERFGAENIQDHFADTSDTLCYATNENQSATYALADAKPDLAIVVGGYNSSNTMHLVEILEDYCPTFHIRDANEFNSPDEIQHFNQWAKEMKHTSNWLPDKDRPLRIALTSGASCPDILVDEVLLKLLTFFDGTKEIDDLIKPFEKTMAAAT
jgi:4-hydroxy-3-methylbut-2-enyl diphosphate reductase